MKTDTLELYTDYLISHIGYATATGLSKLVRWRDKSRQSDAFLSERQYTGKDLWQQVKAVVRQIESEGWRFNFDDTIQRRHGQMKMTLMICWRI